MNFFLTGLLAVALPLVVPPVAAPADASDRFEVQKLADGVYALVRTDPPGLMVFANSLVIVNEEDVVVVDVPTSAKAVVAAIRKLTDKPVTFVINTHWHDDHIIGNEVYRDAFPGVEFIAHAKTREWLPNQGLVNRKGMLEGAPPLVARMRGLMAQNKSLGGGALTDEERESYTSDIDLVERYLAVASAAKIILPTITIEEGLTLHRSSRTIEVRYLGRGHTSGDLVVWLPKERIAAAGDVVVWPIPLVGSDQSHPGDWSATLGRLSALAPSILVPGHGPVQRDDAYAKRMAALFASVDRQTRDAVARGQSLEEARKSVVLTAFRGELAGDSAVRGMLFDNYVAGPSVAAAFADARAAMP